MLVKQIPSNPRIPLQLHGAFPSHGGYPQLSSIYSRIFHHKPSIVWYLHFRNPPSPCLPPCLLHLFIGRGLPSGDRRLRHLRLRLLRVEGHHRPRQAFSVKGLEKVGKFHRKYGNFELNFIKIGILDGQFYRLRIVLTYFTS